MCFKVTKVYRRRPVWLAGNSRAMEYRRAARLPHLVDNQRNVGTRHPYNADQVILLLHTLAILKHLVNKKKAPGQITNLEFPFVSKILNT